MARRIEPDTRSTFALYDGRRMLGRIVPKGNRFVAYSWPAETFIAECTTVREAANAVMAAAAVDARAKSRSAA